MPILHQEKREVENNDSIFSIEYDHFRRLFVLNNDSKIYRSEIYELAPSCGTCNFIFERIGTWNSLIDNDDLIKILNSGVTQEETDIFNRLDTLFPQDDYIVIFKTLKPKLVMPLDANDYFANEQIKDFRPLPVDYLPHYTKQRYYREAGVDYIPCKNSKCFEFFIPIVAQASLDYERVNYYKNIFLEGNIPTALSFSYYYEHLPAVEQACLNPNIHAHNCMTNIIIDGCHKFMAAAETNSEISLISYISLNHSSYLETSTEKFLEAVSQYSI